MERLLRILLVLAGGSCSLVGEEMLWESKDERVWDRVMAAPAERITADAMEKTAIEFLELAGDRRVAILSVYASLSVASQQSTDRSNFKQRRAYYDDLPEDSRISAMMIAISGNAVLRVRDAQGVITRHVLRGRDPTRITVNGAIFEILFVSTRTMTRFEKCATVGAIVPRFFVTTSSELTEEFCTQAADWLVREVGIRKLDVSLKNNHWFLLAWQYPLHYPFLPGEPPTESEHRKHVRFGCSVFCEEPMSCRQTMGPPLNSVPRSRER